MADFGLILPMARDTTVLSSSRSAYGSHYYAAPEQASDFRNTPEQADIFALGCILHDATDRSPTRVPFAQIRSGGIYGPILEKCTESEPRRRFPNIAALRAALFDLWRTSQFDAPAPADANLIDTVLNNPSSIEAWRRLIGHAESLAGAQRGALLRSINAELIIQLSAMDDVLFSRLMALICEWAESTGFEWAYCDVVGDRLIEAYRVSPVRLRCQIVLAALELAVSHNRWHVMNQAGAMLGQAADNGLIDRILIELDLEPAIERKLRRGYCLLVPGSVAHEDRQLPERTRSPQRTSLARIETVAVDNNYNDSPWIQTDMLPAVDRNIAILPRALRS